MIRLVICDANNLFLRRQVPYFLGFLEPEPDSFFDGLL